MGICANTIVDKSGEVKAPTQVHPSFYGKLPRTPELFIRGTGDNMTVEVIQSPAADNRTDRAKAADRSLEARKTTVRG